MIVNSGADIAARARTAVFVTSAFRKCIADAFSLMRFRIASKSLPLRIKADANEEGHAPGTELLRVYQRFHGRNLFSGAEFPPCKMLHHMKPVKYLGASSRGKLNKLENALSCEP